MKWYYNLKIKMKIIVGFAIVALISVIVGIAGYIGLNTMDKTMTTISENNLPSVQALLTIEEAQTAVKAAERTIFSQPDNNAQYTKEVSNIKNAYNRADESMKVYSKLPMTEEEKAMWSQFQTAWNKWKTDQQGFLDMAAQIYETQDTEAINTTIEKMKNQTLNVTSSSFKEAENLLNQIVEINKTAANNAADLAARAYRGAVITLIIVIVIGVLIAIGLGALIARLISKPIINIANAADKLAQGDLNITIESTANDEIGNATTSFAKMLATIKALVNETEVLTKAAQEGKLDVRGDTGAFVGSWRELVEGINGTLDSVIGPLNVMAEYVDRISKGDIPPKVTDDYNGDFNEVKNNLNELIDAINLLQQELETAVEGQKAGDVDARTNSDNLQGVYKKLAQGINEALDGISNPVYEAVGVINKYAEGDLSVGMRVLPGKQIVLTNGLNAIRTNVLALVEDASELSHSAIEGKLDTRADATKHQGEYKKVVEGINGTLDAVIGPLNVMAEYVDRISKGDIPPKVTDDYKGDFNEVKNNLNACIDGLGALVEGGAVLQKMSVNDYTNRVEGQYAGIFAEISQAINVVRERIVHTVDIINNVSNGDFEDLDGLKKIGRRSENDRLMPSVIKLIENVQVLINEADKLAQASLDGKLDIRGDVGKFEGEYTKVIEGINKMLDAVAEPVQESVAVLGEMSRGNLEASVKGDYKGDLAVIKNAVNDTIFAISGYINDMAMVLTEMTNGNLDVAISSEYKGDFVKIKDSVNSIVKSFNEILSEMNNSAEQVSAGANHVSSSSQALSQGSAEQASSVEEITASMTEIGGQTKQNAINANQANESAITAKDIAVQGNEQMKGMLKAMDEINESSTNISKIIKVIDDIAFQTNILALNAAVEAARAGQHGKGFAVVAEEVRNLAARSANAAKETTDMIESSIKKVGAGTDIANQTAEALGKIVDEVSKVTGLVGDIAVASNEQATGIAQVNQGIEQVAKVTQINTATAEQSASASEELSGQASLLKEMVGRFRLKSTDSIPRLTNQNNIQVKTRVPNEKEENFFKNEAVSAKRESTMASSKKSKLKIALDDKEFGKY